MGSPQRARILSFSPPPIRCGIVAAILLPVIPERLYYVGAAGLRSQAEMPVSCNPSPLSPVITKLAAIPELFALKGARPQMSFQVLISSLSSSLTCLSKRTLHLGEEPGRLSGLRTGLEGVTLAAYVHRWPRS